MMAKAAAKWAVRSDRYVDCEFRSMELAAHDFVMVCRKAGWAKIIHNGKVVEEFVRG